MFLATLLTLAIVSVYGQTSAPKTSEGEVAVELFGLIAQQSGCSTYVVAWVESVTRQVRYRCIDTLLEAQYVVATLGRETKFLIDISRAKAEYHQRFGNAELPRPTSLLAHLLVNNRTMRDRNNAAAPILIYGPVIQIEHTVQKKDELGVWLRDQ